MKIVGLLNYFDEDPEIITKAIEGVRAVGVDYLIAADGPYDLYQSDVDHSSGKCQAAILTATSSMQGCTLIPKMWRGNEVEKRNYMLDYAFECVVEDGDWFLVFDADHFWQSSDYDLKRHLQATMCRAAEVSFADGRDANGDPAWYEARLLMRAVPGMRYEGAHWRVEFPDGVVNSTLKAGDGPMQVPLLDLREQFYVWHGLRERPQERQDRQGDYYHQRDTQEIER